MATTNLGLTGSPYLTEKRVARAQTNNVNVKEMRLIITIGATDYTFEQLPDIGTADIFTFEINSFLRNFVVSELQALSTGSVATNNTIIYTYGFIGLDSNGDPISGETSATAQAVHMNYSFDAFQTFDLANYLNSNVGIATNLLLTDFLNPRKVLLNGYVALSSFRVGDAQRWYAVFTDASDTIVADNEITPVFDGTLGSDLNYGSTLIQQFNETDATKLSIFIADAGSGSGFARTLRSRIYTFERENMPCNYVELLWVNQFGAMEVSLFMSNVAISTQIEKKTFEKVRPVNPTSLDRGQTVYKVESVKRMQVWSDFESMENIEKLNYIALSPQVAVLYNGKLVPVIIENTQVDDFNYYEPVNRLTLDIVLANKRINVV